ncbi:MAG TPA: bifunctional DNA-formamidopyrimidine glycosylase/DNA-(apurinic or apyrimidinic site) lyase [Candidatus Dormibacteraeota bacterium]|nr:bifunctional DNA-formamidopyrimidine glycosylase/DNA-(apurinic or apyrimidinic site) lyase [Candidatus Dormibacteraeota bacterium]
MPELPEVETIVRGLNKLLVGKTISSVDFDYPKSFPNNLIDVNKFLIGSQISTIQRRGKVIIINLINNYSLIVHLKMTGQLIYRSQQQSFGGGHPTDSLIGNLPDKSTRVTLEFSDSSKLFFNDQRKFGWMRLLPNVDIDNIDFFKKLGPEPLESNFSWQILYNRLLKRPKSSIKSVLLDQGILAGIGNIYADESLWMTKIHPVTKVNKLSKSEIKNLHSNIREVLNLSLDKGGSTDRNYLNAEGKKGSYLEFANVFRRQGQPCIRCGETIIKFKLNGRGTHICPKEQRLIE